MEKMNLNRNKIRIFLYIFFIFTVLVIGLIVSSVKADTLSKQLTASTQRSLGELEEYISAINTSLTKGLYSGSSSMLSDISNDLTRDASSAKTALAALPFADTRLDNTSRFLSQVGSFVASLNRKAAFGEKLSEKEIKQLKTLISYSERLNNEFLKINESLESGALSFSDTDSTLEKGDTQIKSLKSTLNDISQTAGDYPTLIYDGPFSDHILQQKPRLCENEKTLTKQEAKKKAVRFLNLDEDSLRFTGEQNGDIPSYIFSSDDTTVSITKKGGYPVYMLGSGFAGEIALSEKEAIEKASEFLTSRGFVNMKDSYYFISDGICTINFEYFRGEIIYYADLIKVSVSLDNGNIVSFDARGYIMNHCERELQEPAISKLSAQKKLSPLLEPVNSRLAVIPTDYASEKLCWEFHCKNDKNEELLVYIDTVTGEENDILILLYSDNGILTK